MIPVRIVDLVSDFQKATVVLEDVEQRVRFAFTTDPRETHRLAKEMGRMRCRCNPVYDFIQSLLGPLDATISRVVLDDMGRGIRALVYLQRKEAELTIPCYPPDALALALREKVPVYATGEVLAQAERLSPPGSLPLGPPEVRQWLKRVRPADFSSGTT